MRAVLIACLLSAAAMTAHAQPAAYSPAEPFAARTPAIPASTIRTSSGVPGPDYWQNRADYQIHATLDDKTPSLSGSEVITYTNNSPDTLDLLWLQIDQN